MKKKKITIGTPHRRDFTPEYLLSLVETLRDGRFEYRLITDEGAMVHYNRNRIAKKADGDYLLFIDSDMLWVPDDIQKLVDADKDIAVGLAYNRSYPPLTSTIINISGYFSSHLDIPKEPFEIVSSGAAFMLIKKKVLDAFFSCELWPFDLIPTDAVDPAYLCGSGGGVPSNLYWEDHSFCWIARLLGFEVWCIPSAVVGHVGSLVYVDPERLSPDKWAEAVKKMESFSNQISVENLQIAEIKGEN